MTHPDADTLRLIGARGELAAAHQRIRLFSLLTERQAAEIAQLLRLHAVLGEAERVLAPILELHTTLELADLAMQCKLLIPMRRPHHAKHGALAELDVPVQALLLPAQWTEKCRAILNDSPRHG